MSKIHLYYNGWLALPASVRQKLGLATGDRLEIELTDGAIVLRPARQAVAPEATAAVAEPAAPPAAAAPAPVVKRSPGRPRKAPVTALPPRPKTRGRRKSGLAIEAQPQ
jgi:AbrB family looped-hinge helix DNA binding protein